MNIKLDKYNPLIMYLSPASIPQIVAHIQDYLVKHPILSVETIAEIIVQSLQEHPELINGEAIPISAESQQSIKAYIDALPFLDTYTKAEINALLLGKQDTLTFDQAPTPGSSNPVTSSGIIAAMSALQSALETQINNKADRASTYTKTQVDTLLEDKADADDVYSKNTMDAKLLEVNTDIDNLEDDLSHQSQQIANVGSNVKRTGSTNTGAQINSGSYFWVDGSLCRAKSNIASGETFTDSNRTIIISGGLNDIISLLGLKADYPNSLPCIPENQFNSNETIVQTFERSLGITINKNTRGLIAMGVVSDSFAQDMTSGMRYSMILLICAGYYQSCICLKSDAIYFAQKSYDDNNFSDWKSITLS